jgi:phosphatidylinositol glycan class N
MAASLQVIGAVLLHLVFLASVFDIYFISPVLQVSQSHSAGFDAPARRLVLFVADGLRAETFYNDPKTSAPFLREIMEKHGSWGISHTRVPTESRPGHVAIIAGMYEDPSAITRGWKENPVDFDTVFNQSNWVWSWGSPDILPMFAKGVTDSRMAANMYSSDLEDFFGAEDLNKLDFWVFDHVKEFFQQARDSVDLQMKLREEKVVLFLHLLDLIPMVTLTDPDQTYTGTTSAW